MVIDGFVVAIIVGGIFFIIAAVDIALFLSKRKK